ncbi:MogA/MoaB family molybdenum cofactor biosynthesis protein [Bacillus sp. RG28]|uniref:Molybdenum cofactor biosynthesis protein B n=1 Tax=Gottfriedia endophytica TaxID=2820819 RepID=A0A940SK92_9BACI|nr:MogA/MoaB family molybdenum cofactor biosynthesis protein [Gottfriedia endophytica]MBP0725764.1 MogA/MoaB family molybdenum cofactor biosynthesis protein [Gottfriedia endophytica]
MHSHNPLATVQAAVLTVSDTRDTNNDESGKLIKTLLIEKNHSVVDYKITKDDLSSIVTIVNSWIENSEIQVIILTGGTGFTHRDVTYEAISTMLEKEMQGFGELFRGLSYTEIGPKAMFSRAIAGSIKDKAIYALPGSTNAVNLAMVNLILPTCQHFLEELKRK